MPTWESADRFKRDYNDLSAAEKKAFKSAVTKFMKDLQDGKGFRVGLRVKGVQGAPGIYEMTWAPDSRATFSYGDSIQDDAPHIIWRRIGTHAIL